MHLYPAIKARMGDWDYYIVRMTMREVANEVQLASDIWDDRTLSEAIQRALDESRAKNQIVRFLERRDDRLFSSLVVAAIGGSPSWHSVESRFFGSAFGELCFGTTPKYFALDGQHRLRAIKELVGDIVNAPAGFLDEQLSVIVVVREDQSVDDTEWLKRYRRLFSSLNRYAKPTDADTNIIMDEDDVFAIVTRRLITDHEFFRAKSTSVARVLTKGKNLRSGSSYFTSLQTLYEVNRILIMDVARRNRFGGTREQRIFKQTRPEEVEIDRYYQSVSDSWDALLEAVPDLRSHPEIMRNHDIPSPNPDGLRNHLLFWPIGQELFASAARQLLDQSGLTEGAPVSAMTRTLRPLAGVTWDLHEAPWRFLLLVPSTPPKSSWRIRSEERKSAIDVAARILYWILGLDSLSEDDETRLKEDWRDLLYHPDPLPQEGIDSMWKEVVAMRTLALTSE